MLQPYQLQAITSAIGDVLTAFGGVWETRTTATAQAGDTTLGVESVQGMGSTGTVVVGGDTYTYAALSGNQLTGLAYLRGGVGQGGLAQGYPPTTSVVDVSGTRSLLDQVKQTYFIGTAVGEDLSIIGRNLGVPRLPQVQNDDQYHRIIKAIAYGPRGTTYCLHLALEALLGSDNFAIYQTPDKPGTVTVVMPYALSGDADIETASFLDRSYTVTLSGTSFTQSNVPANARQIYGLHQSAFNADPKLDFSVVSGSNASAAPAGLTLPLALGPSDAGSIVVIKGGTAQRTGGGNNNGVYTLGAITSAQASPATVPLVQASGSDGVAQSSGVFTASGALFTYPNDLGKTLRITAGPAQGTYTVAKLLEPHSGRDLAAYSTPLATACTQAVLSPAPANAADGAPFVLDASLVTESNLTYQLGGRCLQNGSLPAPLTVPNSGSYTFSADFAAGGALHATGDVEVPFTADGSTPVPVGVPIYLGDPSSALEAYVDDLLPAGVALNFDYT